MTWFWTGVLDCAVRHWKRLAQLGLAIALMDLFLCLTLVYMFDTNAMLTAVLGTVAAVGLYAISAIQLSIMYFLKDYMAVKLTMMELLREMEPFRK